MAGRVHGLMQYVNDIDVSVTDTIVNCVGAFKVAVIPCLNIVPGRSPCGLVGKILHAVAQLFQVKRGLVFAKVIQRVAADLFEAFLRCR